MVTFLLDLNKSKWLFDSIIAATTNRWKKGFKRIIEIVSAVCTTVCLIYIYVSECEIRTKVHKVKRLPKMVLALKWKRLILIFGNSWLDLNGFLLADFIYNFSAIYLALVLFPMFVQLRSIYNWNSFQRTLLYTRKKYSDDVILLALFDSNLMTSKYNCIGIERNGTHISERLFERIV